MQNTNNVYTTEANMYHSTSTTESKLPHWRLNAIAKRLSHEPCLVWFDEQHRVQTLSYAELIRGAKQWATFLREDQGLAPGTAIAIFLPRGPQYYQFALACWFAGLSFMPLPSEVEAANHVLTSMQTLDKKTCIITTKALLGDLQTHSHAIIFYDQTIESRVKELALPEDDYFCQDESLIANIYSSSGTTGTPKLIAVPIDGITDRVDGHTDYIIAHKPFGDIPQPNILNFAGYDFDASLMEFLLAGFLGGRCIIASDKVRRENIAGLSNFATLTEQHGFPINIVVLLPRIIKQMDPVKFHAIKAMITMGENVERDWLNKWFKHIPDILMLNGYGPVETTFGGTLTRILPNGLISIENPMPGIDVYLQDLDVTDGLKCIASSNERPIAELSELEGYEAEVILAGNGIAHYLNRPELNAEKFFTINGIKAFRTADLVRVQQGRLIYLYRNDRNRKSSGKQDDKLDKHELQCKQDLNLAFAIIIDVSGYMFAFIAGKDEQPLNVETIYNYFDAHQIPIALCFNCKIKQEKLTARDKTDRRPKTLKSYGLTPLRRQTKPTQATASVQTRVTNLCHNAIFGDTYKCQKIIHSVFGIEITETDLMSTNIGMNDNLFDCGLNSLTIAGLVADLWNAFAKDKSQDIPSQFFTYVLEHPTIAEISHYIECYAMVTLETIWSYEHYPNVFFIGTVSDSNILTELQKAITSHFIEVQEPAWWQARMLRADPRGARRETIDRNHYFSLHKISLADTKLQLTMTDLGTLQVLLNQMMMQILALHHHGPLQLFCNNDMLVLVLALANELEKQGFEVFIIGTKAFSHSTVNFVLNQYSDSISASVRKLLASTSLEVKQRPFKKQLCHLLTTSLDKDTVIADKPTITRLNSTKLKLVTSQKQLSNLERSLTLAHLLTHTYINSIAISIQTKLNSLTKQRINYQRNECKELKYLSQNATTMMLGQWFRRISHERASNRLKVHCLYSNAGSGKTQTFIKLAKYCEQHPDRALCIYISLSECKHQNLFRTTILKQLNLSKADWFYLCKLSYSRRILFILDDYEATSAGHFIDASELIKREFFDEQLKWNYPNLIIMLGCRYTSDYQHLQAYWPDSIRYDYQGYDYINKTPLHHGIKPHFEYSHILGVPRQVWKIYPEQLLKLFFGQAFEYFHTMATPLLLSFFKAEKLQQIKFHEGEIIIKWIHYLFEYAKTTDQELSHFTFLDYLSDIKLIYQYLQQHRYIKITQATNWWSTNDSLILRNNIPTRPNFSNLHQRPCFQYILPLLVPLAHEKLQTFQRYTGKYYYDCFQLHPVLKNVIQGHLPQLEQLALYDLVQSNEAPTITSSVIAYGLDRTDGSQNNVEILNDKGDKPPIFLLCPLTGDVPNYYRNLFIEPDQPAYALKLALPTLAGDDYASNMKTKANYFARLIKHILNSRSNNVTRSCAIAGWSFGGLLGLAVINCLEVDGIHINYFINIDGTSPSDITRFAAKDRSIDMLLAMLDLYRIKTGLNLRSELNTTYHEITNKSPDNVIEIIFSKTLQLLRQWINLNRDNLPEAIEKQFERYRIAMLRAKSNLTACYSFTEYADTIRIKAPTVVLVSDDEPSSGRLINKNTDFNSWKNYAKECTLIFIPDCDHFNIFLHPEFKRQWRTHNYQLLLRLNSLSTNEKLTAFLRRQLHTTETSRKHISLNASDNQDSEDNRCKVEDAFAEFVAGNISKCLLLQGLPGMGKTHNAKQYAYSCSQTFLTGESPWFPIYVKALADNSNLVDNTLMAMGLSRESLTNITQLIPSLLLIVDGCCEQTIQENIFKQNNLARWGENIRVIYTSRKAYYTSQQISLYFTDDNYRIDCIYLSKLTDDDILALIRDIAIADTIARDNSDSLDYFEMSDDDYDQYIEFDDRWYEFPKFLRQILNEAFITPLLIPLAAKQFANKQKITRLSIYQDYFKSGFENVATSEDITDPCKPIYMQLRENIETYSKLLAYYLFKDKVIPSDHPYFGNHDTETLFARKACQIIIDRSAAYPEGILQFQHATYMEFLLAKLTLREVIHASSTTLQTGDFIFAEFDFTHINNSVIFEFFIDMIQELPFTLYQHCINKLFMSVYASRQASTRQQSICHAGANAITCLVALNIKFSGMDFSGIRAQSANWSSGTFHYTNFHAADVSYGKVHTAAMQFANLTATNMTDMDFARTAPIKLTFDEERSVNCIAIHPDRDLMAFAFDEGDIYLYDMSCQQVTHILPAQTDEMIFRLIFSPSKNQLVALATEYASENDMSEPEVDDYILAYWDIEKGTLIDKHVLHASDPPLLDICVNDTGEIIILSQIKDVDPEEGEKNVGLIYNYDTGNTFSITNADLGDVDYNSCAPAYHPEKKYYAYFHFLNDSIILIDLNTGKIIYSEHHQDAPDHLCFDSSGEYFIFDGNYGLVVYHIASGRKINTIVSDYGEICIDIKNNRIISYGDKQHSLTFFSLNPQVAKANPGKCLEYILADDHFGPFATEVEMPVTFDGKVTYINPVIKSQSRERGRYRNPDKLTNTTDRSLLSYFNASLVPFPLSGASITVKYNCIYISPGNNMTRFRSKKDGVSDSTKDLLQLEYLKLNIRAGYMEPLSFAINDAGTRMLVNRHDILVEYVDFKSLYKYRLNILLGSTAALQHVLFFNPDGSNLIIQIYFPFILEGKPPTPNKTLQFINNRFIVSGGDYRTGRLRFNNAVFLNAIGLDPNTLGILSQKGMATTFSAPEVERLVLNQNEVQRFNRKRNPLPFSSKDMSVFDSDWVYYNNPSRVLVRQTNVILNHNHRTKVENANFGLFGQLATELLSAILQQVDYQSRARFALSCRAAYRLAHNLQKYNLPYFTTHEIDYLEDKVLEFLHLRLINFASKAAILNAMRNKYKMKNLTRIIQPNGSNDYVTVNYLNAEQELRQTNWPLWMLKNFAQTYTAVSFVESNPRRQVYLLSASYHVSTVLQTAIRIGLIHLITQRSLSSQDIKALYPQFENDKMLRLLDFMASLGWIFKDDKDTYYASNLLYANNNVSTQQLSSADNWLNIYNYFTDASSPSSQPELITLLANTLTVDITETGIRISGTADHIFQELLYFHWLSRAMHVACELELFTSYRDGVINANDLLSRHALNPEKLNQMLSLLTRYGLLENNKQGYRITKLGNFLVPSFPGNQVATFKMVDKPWWQAMRYLESGLRAGSSSYESINGIGFYQHYQQDADYNRQFDEGIACFSEDDDRQIVLAYLTQIETYREIVDIGGGNGGFLAAIYQRFPNKQLSLYDQPDVVAHPTALDKAEITKRCFLYAGSFFSPPKENNIPRGKSLYVIKGVLHNFNDQKCVTVLQNCHDAMADDSELLVIERAEPLQNQFDVNHYANILMLVLFGSQERSVFEWRYLFELANLHLIDEAPTRVGDFNLLRCRKLS